MSRVLVIGSANVDMTVRVSRLPRVGETVSGGEYYGSFGGKGANQAVAALRAGSEVRFLAKVGRDINGDRIISNLESLGLSTDYIMRDESHPSGVALIIVDAEGRNAIAVAPGSNRHLVEEDLIRAESLFSWAKVLLIQLEVPLPAVKAALQMARAHGILAILNPAPAVRLPEEIFEMVDILTPNETEAAALAGKWLPDPSNLDEVARIIAETGPDAVIVTLGDKGALLVEGARSRLFDPFQVDPVDSTAAGDAFNGALASALGEGRSMEEAIVFANAAGALTVTRKGAQDALPTRDEIIRLIEKQSMKNLIH